MWIENTLQSGLSLQEINKDIAAKQNGIIQTGLALHAAIPTDRLTFMDRGIPDSISYLRLAGINTAEAHKSAMIYHYRAVFIFDRLPIVQDEVRNESDEVAANLDALLEQDYRALGYSPIRVPVMPVAKRADFMLKTLGIVP
jgi:predicted ATPase